MIEPTPQQSASFGELSDELIFFTPAIAYVKAGFDRDLVREYLDERSPPDDEAPFVIDCQWPIFQGLGCGKLGKIVVDWDKRLYAIPKHRWPEFLSFVTSVAFYKTKPLTYGRIVCHAVIATDVVAMHTRQPLASLPLFSVSVLSAAMVNGTWFMSAAADPPRTRPFPIKGGPRADILHESTPVIG